MVLVGVHGETSGENMQAMVLMLDVQIPLKCGNECIMRVREEF